MSIEILTIKEPQVKPTIIQTENYKDPSNSVSDGSKQIGNFYPFIKINGLELNPDAIGRFQLESKGMLPKIQLVFDDFTKQFQNDFPKDGDLIELYIRSRNNDLKKKIRLDFDILTVSGFPNKGTTTFKISGVMRVPDIFSEKQVSLSSDTSFNHLLKICDLLQLGFASNETNTNDTMPRFCANDTLKEFINTTVETVYKDDNSFFTSFVDLYYYLNLVNVNSLFTNTEDLEDSVPDLVSSITSDKSNNTEGVTTSTKLILSNHESFSNTSNFITSYSLFNNAGEIWTNNGYKRYVQFMNLDNFERNEFFIDPITTPGAEKDKVILKGKAGDSYYENQNKFVYLGRQLSTQNSGNLHPNYYYAKVLNYQNLTELNKMGLTITLNGISSDVLRYRRIPVVVFEKESGVINNATMQQGDQDRNTVPDNTESSQIYNRTENYIANNFISGFYVVKDFVIIWNKGFTQQVNLVKREWDIPYSAGVAKNQK